MANQTDLTQGSIPKQLIRFAIPLAASSVLQSMYGLVDMVVAGRFIGSTGLSAINNGSTVMQMITSVAIGLCTGGNILIGQYYGARDRDACHRATVTLLTSAALFGTVLAVIVFFLAGDILKMLDAPAIEDAGVYLRICSLGGILAILGYNAAAAALRAVGNSKAPLICVAVTTGLNIVLDVFMVGVLDMGVAGAAWATIIAQIVSFIVALAFVLKSPDLFGFRLNRLYIRAKELKMILKLGIPCAVQMSVASISWLSVTYILNGYGLVVSAGNGVSAKIKDFCQQFTLAMCNASASMIAQNIGAGEFDRARKTTYTAMRVTVCMALCIIVVVEILAVQMTSLFTSDPEVIEAAVRNLRIEIMGQVFYASFLVYHSLALGAGHTWFVFFSSFVNCIVVRLVLAFLFSHLFGLNGVYWACMIAPLSSVPLGVWYERSDRWRRTLVK